MDQGVCWTQVVPSYRQQSFERKFTFFSLPPAVKFAPTLSLTSFHSLIDDSPIFGLFRHLVSGLPPNLAPKFILGLCIQTSRDPLVKNGNNYNLRALSMSVWLLGAMWQTVDILPSVNAPVVLIYCIHSLTPAAARAHMYHSHGREYIPPPRRLPGLSFNWGFAIYLPCIALAVPWGSI